MSINQIGFSDTHSFHPQETNFFMEDDSNPYNPICRPPFYSSRMPTLPFLPNSYHAPSTWLAPSTSPLPLFEFNHGADSGPSKEHLFEKPLTPSDVGKLNRLVIPKQHAERFFPLAGEAVEKGLLLGFEDESGKYWKFRYSYWNSSQSYVLTKGWSRYVKEKQLDAGDIVLFQRHRLDGERLFIGWRRRADGEKNNTFNDNEPNHHVKKSKISPSKLKHDEGVQSSYHRAGSSVQESIMALPRKVRLFGVNLEYQVGDQSSEPSTPSGSSMSTHGLPHQYYNSHPAYSSSHMVGYNY